MNADILEIGRDPPFQPNACLKSDLLIEIVFLHCGRTGCQQDSCPSAVTLEFNKIRVHCQGPRSKANRQKAMAPSKATILDLHSKGAIGALVAAIQKIRADHSAKTMRDRPCRRMVTSDPPSGFIKINCVEYPPPSTICGKIMGDGPG